MTQQFNFNHHCERLIANSKRRDGQRVAQRLEEIRRTLERAGYGMTQTMFGGSVKRGTDVTGLSDVDALLIVNDSSLVGRLPSDIIELVQEVVQSHFRDIDVTAGDLAVTVNYANGPEIQLLPAVRTNSDGIRIAERGSKEWSNITRPEAFAEKLVEVNNANGARVVPVIKLAKAMADCHVKRQSRKISGYHMEALAIGAFNNYDGPTDTKSMLIHFLTYSMDATMSPIVDPTGQTPHVDDRLGTANSDQRKRTSGYFENMRGQVRNCNTSKKFNNLFCIGNQGR